MTVIKRSFIDTDVEESTTKTNGEGDRSRSTNPSESVARGNNYKSGKDTPQETKTVVGAAEPELR